MLDKNIARQEVTLIGFVYEHDARSWEKGVGISTGDEAYIVEMNELGEALWKETDNDVRVTGYLSQDPDGQNRILVTGYEVLPSDFEPDRYTDLDEEAY